MERWATAPHCQTHAIFLRRESLAVILVTNLKRQRIEIVRQCIERGTAPPASGDAKRGFAVALTPFLW